jgi:hypothetical protein
MTASARSRTRSRLLTVGLAAIVLTLAAAQPAGANHLWRMSNGAWIHQHTRTFPVYRYELGNTTWSIASALAEKEWTDNTILSLPYTNCHSCSRIHTQAAGYGTTGWLGLAEAQNLATTGHYTHGHVYYNWSYEETSAFLMHTACQEYGHLLGLDHDHNVVNCMNNDNILIYALGNGPSKHDSDLINSTYPATGH